MEKEKLTIKDSSIAFISSFVVCQLAVFATSFVVLFFGSIFNISDVENFSASCIGNCILTSVMYVTMFLIYKFLTKKKENTIIKKVKLNKIFIYLLIAVVCFICLYPIVNSFDFLLKILGIENNPPKFNYNIKNYFICLIPMVILPAICEELLFRGLIFKGLKKHGKIFSLIITSLMFAIYHMSIHQTLYPIQFGLVLTFVMYKEDNIIYSIIMHFTNNLIALTLMFLNINLFISKIWYYLLATILLIIFTILLIYFIKKQKNTQKNEKIEKNYLFVFIFSMIIMFILWLIFNIYR